MRRRRKSLVLWCPTDQRPVKLTPEVLEGSAEALHTKFARSGTVLAKRELVGLLQALLTEAPKPAAADRCPPAGGSGGPVKPTLAANQLESQAAPGTPSVLWTMPSANAQNWAEAGEEAMDEGDETATFKAKQFLIWSSSILQSFVQPPLGKQRHGLRCRKYFIHANSCWLWQTGGRGSVLCRSSRKSPPEALKAWLKHHGDRLVEESQVEVQSVMGILEDSPCLATPP